jgi:ABC-type sugar transport system permease subunit
MLLPTLVLVLGVVGYPWVSSGWLSLNHYDPTLGTSAVFIGLENYRKTFADPLFFVSLRHTLLYTVENVVLANLLGLGMALVLNERFRGQGAMRSLMLVPWAMSSVVVGTIWLWLLDGTYGTLNALLYRLGLIHDYMTFFNLDYALPLLGIMLVWNQAPLSALLFLAGLQSVPPNLYRSAKMDSANALQRFWHITLPWLRPTWSVVLILQTVNAVMTFELVYVVTQGGPGTETTLVSWLGYQTTFMYFKFGEGSAILYSLSLICLLLAYGYLALLERGQKAGSRRVAETPRGEAARLGLLAPGPAVAWTGVALPRRHRKPWLRPRATRRLRRVLLYGAAIGIALWSLLPLVALVLWSVTPLTELLDKPASIIPIAPTFENYYEAFFYQDVGFGNMSMAAAYAARYTLVNSLVIGLSVTVIGVAIGTLSAYAFSRYARWRITHGLYFVLMMTRMIPGLVMIVPWFLLFKTADLLDSRTGLIVTYTSFIVPLVVWVLKGYFDTIPRSVEQAALVDGCSRFQVFLRVALPLAVPGLAAACIFSFLVSWNEFVYAALLTSSDQAQTIQVTLAIIMGVVKIAVEHYGKLFAVGVVTIIPPVLIAFILQRYLVQGMLSGSTKG